MKRNNPRVALLLATVALCLPAQALAQGTTTPTTSLAIPNGMTVEKAGEPLSNVAARINIADCADNAELSFDVTSALLGTASISVMEIWVGSGENAACDDPANRKLMNTSGTTSGTTNCWLLDTKKGFSAPLKEGYKTTEVFDRRQVDPEKKECPEASAQQFSVYFVALPSETSQKPNDPPAAITTLPGGTIKAVFTLYTQRPAAPTKPSPSSGEDSVGLSWKGLSSGLTGTKYRAYYDVAQGDGGDAGTGCGSGALVPGEAPPPESDNVIRGSAGSGKSDRLGGLDALGVGIGDYVAAAAVTIDIAGNESVLSDVVCIKREQTDGFYDRYQGEGGDGLDTCSAHAPARASWGGLGYLTVLAIALVSRRRRAA